MKQERMTRFIKSEEANQKWFVVDAKDKVLGRLATEVARIIRGKNKPTFTPNMDTGDFVIVVNAEQVKIADKREQMKEYHHYSGYPGGLKIRSYREMIQKKPEFVIQTAVSGMLPKTKLGKKLIKKLKVYKGTEHPHSAQKPEMITV